MKFKLEQITHQLLTAKEKMSVTGKLWIVEIGRIRVHQSTSDD